MPRVPVGNKYTAKVTGSVFKHVACSYCGCKFVYHLKRDATGEASSLLWLNNAGASNKAKEVALNSLDEKLRHEFDAISCPDCGMYQKKMVNKLKKDAWNEVLRVAITFGAIGGILVAVGFCLFTSLPESLQLTLLMVVVGFWLVAVTQMVIRASNLDPNANAKKRRGRSFSENYPVLRLAEFEELTQKERHS